MTTAKTTPTGWWVYRCFTCPPISGMHIASPIRPEAVCCRACDRMCEFEQSRPLGRGEPDAWPALLKMAKDSERQRIRREEKEFQASLRRSDEKAE